MKYSFKLGLGGVHYSDHLGDLFERKLTTEEQGIMNDMMDGLLKPHYFAARQKREDHEAAVLNRMRAFGVNEQHTLKRELS